MKHTFFYILSLFLMVASTTKSAEFQSYNTQSGHRIDNMYRWRPVEKSESLIKYNKNESFFYVDGKKYELLTPPCDYIITQYYKYTIMEGIDDTMQKVFIKIFFYDNLKQKRVCIMGENGATRFWCY